ncbi:MAG TPA: calcium-binding protein [Gaiellaceae bacterium]|nr:calcium-binding protein [Gaiellaceae bacterium]
MAATLTVPAAGEAASIYVTRGVVVYSAGAGEENAVELTVTETFDPEFFELNMDVTVRDNGALIVAGTGCTALAPSEALCQVSHAASGWADWFAAYLRGEADTFTAAGERTDVGNGVTVFGGAGADELEGTEEADTLRGGPGDDMLDGRAGTVPLDKFILGGDRLFGGAGADLLSGGDGGHDELRGGLGADTLRGGRGPNDVVSYQGLTDRVVVRLNGRRDDGRPGERDLVARDVEDVMSGSGNDLLIGNDRGNWLAGGPGDDALIARGGRDLLEGDPGGDSLRGGFGHDRIYGDSWHPRGGWWPSRVGRDTALGGAGNDRFEMLDRKRDRVVGGTGRDRARVDAGRDLLFQIELILDAAF